MPVLLAVVGCSYVGFHNLWDKKHVSNVHDV